MAKAAQVEMPPAPPAEEAPRPLSIIEAISARYNMRPEAFQATVIATCFPQAVSREEFAAGMLIAYRLELNPITKEVHFARAKGGGVQAIIGVDGWYGIANRHPQYDGCDFSFEWAAPNDKGETKPLSCTCRIFRKDRSHPTEVTEFMSECVRSSEAWKLTPSRMLRHRAFGQCARVAFSIGGIMDADEFARWNEDGPAQAADYIANTIPKLPRKSSAESKRDGSVAKYNELLAKIKGATEVITCTNIWVANKAFLESVATGWFKTLSEEFVSKMDDLGMQLDTDDYGWPILQKTEEEAA